MINLEQNLCVLNLWLQNTLKQQLIVKQCVLNIIFDL